MSKSTPLTELQQPLQQVEHDQNTEQDVEQVLQSLTESFSPQPPPPPQQFPVYAPYEVETKIVPDDELLKRFFVFDSDVKMAAICAAVFVIVTYIPLEKIVFKYISLDKVPYSGIIVKALTAAFLFFVVAKMMKV